MKYPPLDQFIGSIKGEESISWGDETKANSYLQKWRSKVPSSVKQKGKKKKKTSLPDSSSSEILLNVSAPSSSLPLHPDSSSSEILLNVSAPPLLPVPETLLNAPSSSPLSLPLSKAVLHKKDVIRVKLMKRPPPKKEVVLLDDRERRELEIETQEKEEEKKGKEEVQSSKKRKNRRSEEEILRESKRSKRSQKEVSFIEHAHSIIVYASKAEFTSSLHVLHEKRIPDEMVLECAHAPGPDQLPVSLLELENLVTGKWLDSEVCIFGLSYYFFLTNNLTLDYYVIF